MLDGITLSGGEPFFQAEAAADLAKKAHEMGLNVWTYTGYTWEEIFSSDQPAWKKLLRQTDVLVDGRFLKPVSYTHLDVYKRQAQAHFSQGGVAGITGDNADLFTL